MRKTSLKIQKRSIAEYPIEVSDSLHFCIVVYGGVGSWMAANHILERFPDHDRLICARWETIHALFSVTGRGIFSDFIQAKAIAYTILRYRSNQTNL